MNVDRAEAAFWSTWIRNRNVDAGSADDGAVPVAGGFALCLTGTEIAYALGVGTTRPLRPDDCAVIREFYTHRGLTPSLALHETVLDRDGAIVREAGYVESEPPLAVLEAPAASTRAVPDGQPVAVRLTTDRRAWTELVVRALGDTSPPADPGRLRRTLHATAAASSGLFIASIGGVDAGAAAATLAREYVLLTAGAVLAAQRRRGVHRALLAARLAFGRERGAVTGALTVVPESGAERSAAAAGFARSHLRHRLTIP